MNILLGIFIAFILDAVVMGYYFTLRALKRRHNGWLLFFMNAIMAFSIASVSVLAPNRIWRYFEHENAPNTILLFIGASIPISLLGAVLMRKRNRSEAPFV